MTLPFEFGRFAQMTVGPRTGTAGVTPVAQFTGSVKARFSLFEGDTLEFGVPGNSDAALAIDALATDVWLYREGALWQRYRVLPMDQAWDHRGGTDVTVKAVNYRHLLDWRHIQPVGSLAFPGSIGNHASVPDSGPLSIAGDITFVARVAMADWASAALPTTIVGQLDSATNISYHWLIMPDGTLQLSTSPDGTSASVVFGASTVAIPASDGDFIWLATALDVNSGGNRVYWFATSLDGATWTQLGTTVTTAGVTTIFNSSAPILIGGNQLPTFEYPMNGRVEAVSIRNGVSGTATPGGTEVFGFDGRDIGPRNDITTFTARTGQTVTLARSGTPETAVVAATPNEVIFGGVDQGNIIWRLIQHTQGQAGGALGITAGDVVTGVVRDRSEYEAGDNIGQLIDDLTKVIAGPVWNVSPGASGDRELNVKMPATDYTFGPNPLHLGGNVRKMSRRTGGGEFANSSFVNSTQETFPETYDDPDIATDPRGRWEVAVSPSSSVTNQSVLQELAEGEVRDRMDYPATWTIQLNPRRWFGDSFFLPGHFAEIVKPPNLVDKPPSDAVSVVGQVVDVVFTLSAKGEADVTLTAVEVAA